MGPVPLVAGAAEDVDFARSTRAPLASSFCPGSTRDFGPLGRLPTTAPLEYHV